MKSASQEGLLKKALATAAHTPVNKAAQIQAFLSSQSRFSGTYAVEGLKESVQWRKKQDVFKDDVQKSDCRLIPAGHGLSSPVLKPRNENVKLTSRNPDTSSKQTFARPVSPLALDRTKGPNETKPKDAHTDSKDAQACKKTASFKTTKNGNQEMKSKPVTKSLSRPKRKRMSSDTEHSEILAQRRERRRLKKEVMDGKEHSVSMKKGVEEKQNKTQRTNERRTKNLPAGLALMHGFNAKNIGKQRITLEPPSHLGVFNKGKASGKQKVGTKGKKLKGPSLFDESAFLGKSAASRKGSRRIGNVFAKDSSSFVSEADEGSDDNLSKDLSDHKAESRDRPNSAGNIEATEPRDDTRDDGEAAEEYKSEIWDIEKEFLQQEHISTIGATEVGGSIVLNSRRWNWHSSTLGVTREEQTVDKTYSKDEHLSSDHPKPELKRDRSCTIVTVSSLGPSQSASQVPPRASSAFITSKHFDHPTNGADVKSMCNAAAFRQDHPAESSNPPKAGKPPSCSSQALEIVNSSVIESTHANDQHNEDAPREQRLVQMSDDLCSLEDAIRRLENEEINTTLTLGEDMTEQATQLFSDEQYQTMTYHVPDLHFVFNDEEEEQELEQPATRTQMQRHDVVAYEEPFEDVHALSHNLNPIDFIEDDMEPEADASMTMLGYGEPDMLYPEYVYVEDATGEDDGRCDAFEARSLSATSGGAGHQMVDPSSCCYTSDIDLDPLEVEEDELGAEKLYSRQELGLGALEDVEALVARSFRKRWYPMRY